MDVSLLDVAIVSNASVVDIVCVVNREGNDESPLQEMFSRTSDSIITQYSVFMAVCGSLIPIFTEVSV